MSQKTRRTTLILAALVLVQNLVVYRAQVLPHVRTFSPALERSLVLSRGDEIGVDDLPAEVVHGEALSHKQNNRGPDHGIGERDFREAKRKFEVAYLTKQLAEHRWNVSRTAATIGLHRQSLQEKLRELGIRRPGKEPLEEE
jgi:DNA-binding NtrC family response regulator